LADPALLAERAAVLDSITRIAHSGRAQRFAWANIGEGRPAALRERYLREIAVWESWWRDILALGAGASEGVTSVDRMPELAKESKLYAAADVAAFLRALQRTRAHLMENVDIQLALENLMLDLPQPRLAGGVDGR